MYKIMGFFKTTLLLRILWKLHFTLFMENKDF